jgi:hypothetical protein
MKDENWRTGLAFLADVLEHVNKLNAIFQGKGLFTSRTSFQSKTDFCYKNK